MSSKSTCVGMGLPRCDPASCYNVFSDPGCNLAPATPVDSPAVGVVCNSHNPHPNSLHGLRCSDGSVIMGDQFCDGHIDCPDGSDEMQGRRGFQCPGHSNRSCLLPQLNLYDDVAHCEDESDLCAKRQRFQCFSEPDVIISRNQVCDGVENCWDNSDEYTQDERIRGFDCPKNSFDPIFICLDKKKFINIYQVCDGRFDCFDRSDECEFAEQLAQEDIDLRCVKIDQCRSIFSSATEMIENVWLRVSLWLVAFIVLIGNTCVIAFTSRGLKKADVSASNKCQQLIILNIAIADIMMGIYLFSISANNVAFSGVYNFEIDKYWRYGLLCHVAGMFAAISSETSCFLMVLLTTFRLNSVARPFASRGATTTFHWKFAIAGAWIASFILAFVPVMWFYLATGAFTPERVDEFDAFLVGLSRDDALDLVENIPFYYSATSVCLPRFYSNTNTRMWPYTCAVITINFISFGYIGIAYIFIYKRSSQQLMKNERSEQISTRMQRRIARIILTDCACWMPICVMSYLALANVSLSDFAYIITAGLLLPINSALNPFLYSSLPDKLYDKLCTTWERFRKRKAAATQREPTKDVTEAEMQGEPTKDMTQSTSASTSL